MRENYFEDFFKSSPNPYSLCKIIFNDKGIPCDYELLEINEAYEKIMCAEASKVIGKKVSEIYQTVCQQDFDKLNEAVGNSLMNSIATELDVNFLVLNKWLRLQLIPLNKYNFGCIVIDVTKEYMKEKQIEWFLNSNLDILNVIDYETKTYRINKKYEDAIGYKLNELEGSNPLTLVHEDDLEETLAVVKELRNNKTVDGFVNRYRCKDGSIKYLEWHGEYHSGYGYFSARDITEKYKEQNERFIKKQLDLVNSINIIDNLEVGYTRYSYPEYKIIDINNKAYDTLKQVNPNVGQQLSLIGMNAFEVFNYNKRKQNSVIRNIQKIEDKKLSYICDYRKLNFAGGKKFIKLIFQPIFGLNEKIIEIIIIEVDITKEVEEKNEMKETIKIQEELLANISHELKTPLNVIFSQNQLMEMYLKNYSMETSSKKFSKGVKIIQQNCYRLTKLINNIIDLSKVKSGFYELHLSNENIVEITKEIVQSVEEYVNEKELTITFNTNTEEKIIACDPEKIERMMLNLISNAVKFTNPGGNILVKLVDKGDIVEVSVEDSGIGIEKKYLNKIFGKFQQVDKSLSRNVEGSGIGLSLVKSFVKMHRGKITVESEVGKGSIFKLEFPVGTIENRKDIKKTQRLDNRIQMINVEFSDICSILK